MAAPVQQYGRRGVEKLTPEVNRILFVKNIPFKITPEEMYDVFGRYGPVRQIRIGSTNATRGTAFVIYENVLDAKQACEHLSGYNFNSRYLVCLFYVPGKAADRMPNEKAREKLGEVSVRSGIVTGARLNRGGGGASSAIPLNSLLAGSVRTTQKRKKSTERGDGDK